MSCTDRLLFVQNTFVNVVDCSEAAEGKRSTLRQVRSDSFLCAQGGQMAGALLEMDEFEDLDLPTSACARQLPRQGSESSLQSTATADASADASSSCEPPPIGGSSSNSGDEEADASADASSSCEPPPMGGSSSNSGDQEASGGEDGTQAAAVARENERLTRENAALVEQVRAMQSSQEAQAMAQVATFSEPCGFAAFAPGGAGCAANMLWVPVACGQPWLDQGRSSTPGNGGDGVGRSGATRSSGGSSVRAPQQQRGFVAPSHEAATALEGQDGTRTTVMLRNLPNNYSRAMLADLLEREGFGQSYNFLYLPIDFKTQAALGYAFIDLACPSVVQPFWHTFDGYSSWTVPSRKMCFVSWCEPNQGLEAHIERYRNSPVMHESVPDEYKPVLLENGQRIFFPLPTKAIRAPRVRDCRRDFR